MTVRKPFHTDHQLPTLCGDKVNGRVQQQQHSANLVQSVTCYVFICRFQYGKALEGATFQHDPAQYAFMLLFGASTTLVRT